MLQARHYVAVAACIHRSRMAKDLIGNSKERAAAQSAIQLVATDLASTFAADNSKFDRQRFMSACGL